MSFSYILDSSRAFVLATFHGVVTDDDIYEYTRSLAADFPNGIADLVDMREIEDFDVSSKGVRRVADFDKKFSQSTSELSVAIVVSSDVIFGMARMYQMLLEPHSDSSAVFRDFDAAKAWLVEKLSTSGPA